ncbi:helix-turn-helix domain-containing protein [Chryseobacterium sp. S90]|uniref:helix-turn-helix domain-containing protein n=1 Tax=Chryseobacterium sp. S90 TaxID=3395373 RepID=UPI0039BD5663
MDTKISKVKNTIPNYKRIYTDMIQKKYPHKKEECRIILEKNKLTTLDIIKLNNIISDAQDCAVFRSNQKHKSYDTETIIKILEYQKKNKITNYQTAIDFKMSRNTLTKWKRKYIV